MYVEEDQPLLNKHCLEHLRVLIDEVGWHVHGLENKRHQSTERKIVQKDELTENPPQHNKHPAAKVRLQAFRAAQRATRGDHRASDPRTHSPQ